MPKSNSKIENSIQELENFLENCKKVPLSPNKIMVNREELEYIIEDIKKNIPEEVERYRKVISNKEAIEKEAQERASELIKLATDKTNELLSENEIMLQARQKADEIVNLAMKQAQEVYDDAVMQGNAYKASAQQYLNDMLVNLHDLIYSCVDQTTRNTNKFLDSLKDVGSTVTDNLNELNGYSVPEEEASEEQPAIEPLDLDLPEE